MRAVVDRDRGVGTYRAIGSLRLRETPHYLEFEYPSAAIPALGPVPVHRVVHLARRDDTSWWILACLDDLYTPFFTAMAGQSRTNQDAFFQSLPETWPLFAELLTNGLSGVNHPACVQVLEDPDVATPKWFVSTVIGNLWPNATLSDVLTRQNGESMDRIVDLAVNLVVEQRARSFNKAALGWRMFRNSVSSDVSGQAKFVKDNFSSLIKALELFRG